MRARLPILLVLLLFPSSALADRSGGPWFGVDGSWSTYSMSDVNLDIQNVNAAIAGSGLTMEEIHDGFGIGLAGGFELPNRAALGVGYDRLFARSDVGDPTGSIEYDFPANTFRVLGEYAFPSTSSFSPRIGLAAGLVSASGTVRVSVTGSGSVSGDVTGTGPLFEAWVGGDWSTAGPFSIVMSVGYRNAEIGEVKVRDSVIYNADGSKYTLDYSGIRARFGLRFGPGR